MPRPALPWLLVFLAITASGPQAAEPSSPADPDAGPQVPVALELAADGQLLVALREGRRIVTVDPLAWTITGSRKLPVRPASLALGDDRATLLVGGQEGQLVVVEPEGAVRHNLQVGRGPVHVLALAGGRVAAAALWDPRVRVFDWRQGESHGEHLLSFAPGALVADRAGHVFVADAFGGRFARLTPGVAKSERTFTIDGIGLHGLALSGDGKELLIAHMFQEDESPITTASIDAGRILSSQLSAIRLRELDSAPAEGDAAPVPARRLTLDGPVHGAADPSALAVSADGTRVVVALAGAHQLLLNDRSQGAQPPGTEDLLPLGHNQRIGVVAVGRSPLAVRILDAPGGLLAVTADAMSDTLTAIRIADRRQVAQVALGPQAPRRTAVQRGEAAFLDGRRSHDRWMSCASCHHAGHTNGRNFDTFGDSGFGAPKNTPSLRGLAGTRPFTWTGHFEALADQVQQSFATSLRGPEPEAGVVDDLVAYLESLPPPPPLRSAGDPAARRGAAVFEARRCVTCHEPPLFTIAATRDVGLDDGPGGHHRFNPPSLRGMGWTAPYLHDGRAATLAEVLRIHIPGQRTPLEPAERDDLIAFLESL